LRRIVQFILDGPFNKVRCLFFVNVRFAVAVDREIGSEPRIYGSGKKVRQEMPDYVAEEKYILL